VKKRLSTAVFPYAPSFDCASVPVLDGPRQRVAPPPPGNGGEPPRPPEIHDHEPGDDEAGEEDPEKRKKRESEAPEGDEFGKRKR